MNIIVAPLSPSHSQLSKSTMSFESNETLSSDDEYAVFSRGASDDESYDDKKYAAYNAKLDADIDLWTSLAAQYEDTDILWPPEPISPEPISQYEQEVIRLEYKAADTDTRLALLAQYIWLADYLDKFDADCAAAEEEANSEEYDKTRPIEYRVTSTGRKDRKRKFAHKTTDAAGRVKEDPKHVVKKPNWRKKKTGREHDPALVQRKDYLKDTFECLKLNYNPALYERPLFERGQEATIHFGKYKRPVFTWFNEKALWF